MKKQLPMTGAMAAALMALPGCSTGDDWNEDVHASRETAVCVDESGYRVDDDLCDDDGFGRSHGFVPYYIGRSGRVPYYGDSVYDRRFTGGFTPTPGVSYAPAPASTKMTRSQAVSRGGLGSRGRGFGRASG